MTEKINKYETIFVLDSTKTEDEIRSEEHTSELQSQRLSRMPSSA